MMRYSFLLPFIAAIVLASTARAACDNPGPINNQEACGEFCDGDNISFGFGVCQCLGNPGLWSVYGECICLDGSSCVQSGQSEAPVTPGGNDEPTASPSITPGGNDEPTASPSAAAVVFGPFFAAVLGFLTTLAI